MDDLGSYYNLNIEDYLLNEWTRMYHENGFDHASSPILYDVDTVGLYSWGLIPWFVKSMPDALMLRNKTLNCISEEMYDKPSFRDSLKAGHRCLIPMTGFFEWKWQDSKGKEKTPYCIHLKEQKIFSLAGIYATWKDQSTELEYHTYSVLTTKANPLMEEIHNNKKRMPVIIPREYEKDWLSPQLSKDDVLALCQPFDEGKMEAYQISKLITSRKESSNVPKVLERVESDRLF
jgi:putative SOS response-associated peptidase YedK